METIITSNPVQSTEEINISSRQQPIPPPSHPRQYRAIGLIYAQYTPLETHLITRGKLVTSEEITIDAVILGRVISIIKNHVDLNRSHLWVVYPRTRPENDHLHAQIVGIWEPQNLDKSELNVETNDEIRTNKSGYFSIRGEVIYHSEETKKVIVKIRQSPKNQNEKPIFFKLELSGTLPEKGAGYFWDFQVKLEGTTLIIQTATNMGRLLPQKKTTPKFNQKKESEGSVTKRKSNMSIRPEKTLDKPPSKLNPLERPKRK